MINQKNIKVTSIDDETRIDKWLKRKFPLLTQSYIENNLNDSVDELIAKYERLAS